MNLFATCDPGLEGVLADELGDRCGIENAQPGSKGVAFQGSIEELWRANLQSRIANRILVNLAEFEAPSRQDLYRGVRSVDFGPWIGPGRTIAVSAKCGASSLSHTGFVGQVVKDAICDQLRGRTGARPDVDKGEPDVPIAARIVSDRCTLSIDSSGQRLHRRGYRTEAGEAPLRETLAAGILALAGWSGAGPLIDPMCGSGTFVIEAAQMARRLAPGLARIGSGPGGSKAVHRFGFQKWPGHDPRAFSRLLRELEGEIRPEAAVPIVGWDLDRRAVEIARRNARRAGVEADLDLARRPLSLAEPLPIPDHGKATIVVNPPYGARIGDPTALALLYKTLGDVLKQRFAGYEAWVLAGDLKLVKQIGLRPARRHVVHNGPIECRLLCYELYSGSKKQQNRG